MRMDVDLRMMSCIFQEERTTIVGLLLLLAMIPASKEKLLRIRKITHRLSRVHRNEPTHKLHINDSTLRESSRQSESSRTAATAKRLMEMSSRSCQQLSEETVHSPAPGSLAGREAVILSRYLTNQNSMFIPSFRRTLRPFFVVAGFYGAWQTEVGFVNTLCSRGVVETGRLRILTRGSIEFRSTRRRVFGIDGYTIMTSVLSNPHHKLPAFQRSTRRFSVFDLGTDIVRENASSTLCRCEVALNALV